MNSLEKQNPFTFFTGNDETFTLPSGHVITIREQNADDDETLSQLDSDNKEQTLKNLNKFLPTIIRQNTFNNGSFMTPEEVLDIKLKDKYYILLKTRLHSIGSNLKFTAVCPDKKCKTKTKFVEDLNVYDTDLSKFKEENERYEYQITPCKAGKDLQRTFTLSTGKRLRYTFMNVAAELRGTNLTILSDNTDIMLRNLEMFNPETQEFEMLGSLNVFSKREKIEIRADIEENDDQFMMMLEMTCPKCKREWVLPFLFLRDFFLPTEI